MNEPVSINTDVPGYESLRVVLEAAYNQAAKGKGKERHADGKPFHNQPIFLIPQLMGDDNTHGLRYQVIKKIQEAVRLPPDKVVHELLGAMVYLAALTTREAERTGTSLFDLAAPRS